MTIDKKIKKIFFVILLSFFFLLSLAFIKSSEENYFFNREKGDAVFRYLKKFGMEVWHTGIYLNSDSKFENYAPLEHPLRSNKGYKLSDEQFKDVNKITLKNSDLKHSVIQANGTDPKDGKLPLSIRSFKDFLFGQKFEASANAGNLSYDQRKDLVRYAWEQRGCKYSWTKVKIPSPSNKGRGWFRCDGLVEYCYEKIGVNNGKGFFPRRQEKIMSPEGLYERMYKYAGNKGAQGTPPQIKEITLKDEAGNSIEPDEEGVYQVSGRITIEADISDGDYGSGVDRMVVLVENDEGDTFYLNGEEYVEGDTQISEESMDDHDENVEGIYAVEWDTRITDPETGDSLFPPGYYTLHILAFDQAGNVGKREVEVKIRRKIKINPYDVDYDPEMDMVYFLYPRSSDNSDDWGIIRTKIDGTQWYDYGCVGGYIRNIALDPVTKNVFFVQEGWFSGLFTEVTPTGSIIYVETFGNDYYDTYFDTQQGAVYTAEWYYHPSYQYHFIRKFNPDTLEEEDWWNFCWANKKYRYRSAKYGDTVYYTKFDDNGLYSRPWKGGDEMEVKIGTVEDPAAPLWADETGVYVIADGRTSVKNIVSGQVWEGFGSIRYVAHRGGVLVVSDGATNSIVMIKGDKRYTFP